MKDKKVLIGIVVAILVLGGGAYFVLSGKDDSKTTNSQAQSTDQTETTNQNSDSANPESSGNLKTLLAAGKAQKCTMKYSGDSGSGDGTMYSNGSDRGLMTMNYQTEQGNSGVSNVLYNKDKVYTWSTVNGQTFGMIFEKSGYESQSSSSSQSGTSKSAPDPNEKFDLNCSAWNVDESILTPPSDVNFTSFALPN